MISNFEITETATVKVKGLCRNSIINSVSSTRLSFFFPIYLLHIANYILQRYISHVYKKYKRKIKKVHVLKLRNMKKQSKTDINKINYELKVEGM